MNWMRFQANMYEKKCWCLLFAFVILEGCQTSQVNQLATSATNASAETAPLKEPTNTPITTIVPTQLVTPGSSPTITPTIFPTRSTAGLSIAVYEIKGDPTLQLDPLQIQTVQGLWYTRPSSLVFPPGKSFIDTPVLIGPQLIMQTDLNGKKLIAHEEFKNSGSKGYVIVTNDDQEIYRIAIGVGGPITALRHLRVYDGHWVLETAYVSEDANYSARGQITEDGILLNDEYNYEEAFGFQTINGKPFYFFKRDQKINAWYDGQEISLGYDRIPHYGCCSYAELNPYAWQNRVDFFGLSGKTWYLVQIGSPDAVTIKP
jgi:hypothetical protein